MIDFHSHILPQMDDGCTSVAETLEILQIMYQSGIDYVCLTPHYYRRKENIEEFLERRSESYEAMIREIQQQKIEVPNMILGAETQFFYGMSRNKELKKLCYENTNYILVELPFQKWNSEVYSELQSMIVAQGITPIVAHAERYYAFGNKIERILDLQIPIQLNSEAFDGKERRRCFKAMKDNKGFLLGSDCHNITARPPNLEEGYAMIIKKLGRHYLEYIKRTGRMILKI